LPLTNKALHTFYDPTFDTATEKQCKRCSEVKPIGAYKVVKKKMKDGTIQMYRRKTCRPCEDNNRNDRTAYTKARNRILEKLKDAPWRAVGKLCRENPDALNMLYQRYPLELKRLLHEAQKEIFEENKRKWYAAGWRDRNVRDLDAMWDRIEEEFFTEKRRKSNGRNHSYSK
jgi:hypothetical protein